ncbi:TetR/AcrR family transcriptional regulator [Bosea sp. RAF48]|uniref:TetR/AcrR family transcriptional regulator n=1 Tax=Bosea sp. RAF48 TaxID=3237480 RepID=UPI003F90973A
MARRSSEHPGRGLRFPGKSGQEDDTLNRQIAAIANFEDLADNRAIWMVTRAELVSRLEQAFLDHGYAHLTMITIADTVDVTRRTLYNYFSSRKKRFDF